MSGEWWADSRAGCASAPAERFKVRPRTKISLAREDWRYGSILRGPVAVCVERVRWDTASCYEAEVWIDGYAVNDAGMDMGFATLLVYVEALRRAVEDSGNGSAGQQR